MNKSKLVWGLALIALGIIWLLNIAGVLSISIWTAFFRLWPMIFIAIGLSIIFNKKPTIKALIWIVFFAVLIIYSIIGTGDRNDHDLDNFTRTISLEQGTKEAQVKMEAGGASVNIQGITDELFYADIYDKDIRFDIGGGKNPDIHVYSGLKSRNITDLGDRYKWDIDLSEKVEWTIDFDAGAVKGEFDLRRIPVRMLTIDIGASQLDLMLSDLLEYSEVEIRAGVSSISITVPEDTGIKLRYQGALVAKNLTDEGLAKKGDHYYSSNYDDAEKKIDILVEMGVGSLDLTFK